VAPQNLIAVYQASGSLGEFHNGIIKLKPPVTKKAKEISSAVSGRIQANGESSGRSQDVGNSEDVHKEHTAAPDKQISNPLEAEIDDLRATLNDRDCQIADLRDLLEKKTRK